MNTRELRSTSPCGAYSLYVTSREMRMSHWIDSPTLIEMFTGTTILDLSESMWSVDDAIWSADGECILVMRRYPGDHAGQVRVNVDCISRKFTIEGNAWCGIQEILDSLERLYEKTKYA